MLVFPPRAFGGEGLPARTAVDYHRAIIQASELPVILFHRPAQFGGVVYPAETLRLLAGLEGVVGLKEASFDATRFIQIVRVNRTFPRPLEILTGNDTFIYESYLLGADGALLGMGATATAPQIAMLDAVRRGDLAAGAALRDRLDPLCQAIYAAPLRNYRVRMKEALVFQGILKNAVVRAPLPSASDEERALIRRRADPRGACCRDAMMPSDASRGGRLAGRVAVVTGGTSGLGRAIALAFSREGAAVAIGDVRERPGGRGVADGGGIRTAGGRAAFVTTDVTRRADVEALVGRAVAEFGALDVMVNNAGIQSTLTPAVEKTEADWQHVITVDLTGVWFGCQAALRVADPARTGRADHQHLLPAGHPGRRARPGRLLRGQGRGVEPHAPARGRGRTPWDHRQCDLSRIHRDRRHSREWRRREARGVRRRTPYRRLGTPEDVAGCAVFLASSESEFVTGQNLVVDGGASIAG